jgi:hypothetical protein
MSCRIALTGYARVGKSYAARYLAERYGLTVVAMGQIIKAQLDDLVQTHLGFSAFTENDAEKKRIREVLVHWGYSNYDAIIDEFFLLLPDRAVNERLFRVREAVRWKAEGGVIWHIKDAVTRPAEPKEEEELRVLYDRHLIDAQVFNFYDERFYRELDRAYADTVAPR